ncbi:MAG: serine/threonine-protein kinase [Pseudanabaena sp. ELA645]|jgi:serine/threonine protein kinase
MTNFPDFSAHGYQVIEQLGQNTQGGRVTYRAQDANGKQVAIKQFQVGGSWDGVKAIEREIRVLEDLKHRGIPAYISSFKSENDMSFCLVTEYVNGRTLSAKRVFTADDVPRIIVQLLEILVYLQQCVPPIIHRDIKPENIMLDDDLNVYLIDFGFARVGASANMSSVAAGSFGFMSPEQLRNLTLGKASDLYSLGMTLICMLGNIASSELGEYIDEKNQLDRKKVAPILSNYNPRLVLWLYNMVKPSAADRYVDAEQALDYLCEALQIKNPSNSRGRSQSLLNRSKESTHSQFNKIKVSTWIALSVMFAICVFDGKVIAWYAREGFPYQWLFSVFSIIMISVSPLVGSWLNGLEKQGKLEGFWKKIRFFLVLVGVNILAGAGAKIIYGNLIGFSFSLSYLFESSLSIMVGAVLGSVWGWTGTFAGAWAGVWSLTSWGFDLYKTLNGSVFLTLGGTVVAGVAVVLASEKLLQSAGKWKAMMILLGTGLTGLGVGCFFVR